MATTKRKLFWLVEACTVLSAIRVVLDTLNPKDAEVIQLRKLPQVGHIDP